MTPVGVGCGSRDHRGQAAALVTPLCEVTDPRSGPFRCEVETREGYVLARQSGKLQTVDEARQVQQAVERALEKAGHGLLLFDNRLTGEPGNDARESMWAWCRDCSFVKRVAILLESDLSLVRANMTAVGKRSPVRSFDTEEAALAWLLASQSRARSR